MNSLFKACTLFFLNNLSKQFLEIVLVITENFFEIHSFALTFVLDHGISFRLFGVGGCLSKHPYAMAPFLIHPFLQNLSHITLLKSRAHPVAIHENRFAVM